MRLFPLNLMDGVAGTGRACLGLSPHRWEPHWDWGQAAPGYFTCLSTLMSCGVNTFYSPWIVDFGRRIKTSQLFLLVGNGVASNNGITEESRLHWKLPNFIGAHRRRGTTKPANIFYKVGPPSDYYGALHLPLQLQFENLWFLFRSWAKTLVV